MDYKLELIVVPVSDVDRSKAFYLDQVGFELIVDHVAGDFRVVQLVPPGSSCAIAMMPTGPMGPGTLHGLHLVVNDIVAARAELVSRGVEAGEPYYFGAEGRAPGVDPERIDYATFLEFHDPDGNTWLVQEVGYQASGGATGST
jgi:catechol 2,3-dioxygenase-like lactoylglutathione lyase family enzyme